MINSISGWFKTKRRIRAVDIWWADRIYSQINFKISHHFYSPHFIKNSKLQVTNIIINFKATNSQLDADWQIKKKCILMLAKIQASIKHHKFYLMKIINLFWKYYDFIVWTLELKFISLLCHDLSCNHMGLCLLWTLE